MSTAFEILASIIVLWSAIYTIGFAVNEIKQHRISGGVTALILTLIMFAVYIGNVAL